jgi:hypothetical protein
MDDSSLILYVNNHYLSLLDFINNNDIEEIREEYNKVINGKKYFLIDYYTVNGLNSIGIISNESFFIYEQTMDT